MRRGGREGGPAGGRGLGAPGCFIPSAPGGPGAAKREALRAAERGRAGRRLPAHALPGERAGGGSEVG